MEMILQRVQRLAELPGTPLGEIDPIGVVVGGREGVIPPGEVTAPLAGEAARVVAAVQQKGRRSAELYGAKKLEIKKN